MVMRFYPSCFLLSLLPSYFIRRHHVEESLPVICSYPEDFMFASGEAGDMSKKSVAGP
jgi:hypothetical protein